MSKINGRGNEYYGVLKCTVCGKDFVPAPYHVYRDRRRRPSDMVLVCTYGCMLKSEQLKREKLLSRLRERQMRGMAE